MHVLQVDVISSVRFVLLTEKRSLTALLHYWLYCKGRIANLTVLSADNEEIVKEKVCFPSLSPEES